MPWKVVLWKDMRNSEPQDRTNASLSAIVPMCPSHLVFILPVKGEVINKMDDRDLLPLSARGVSNRTETALLSWRSWPVNSTWNTWPWHEYLGSRNLWLNVQIPFDPIKSNGMSVYTYYTIYAIFHIWYLISFIVVAINTTTNYLD